MAEWTGLEPATPGVTGRYSNQLNYHSASYNTEREDDSLLKCGADNTVIARLSQPVFLIKTMTAEILFTCTGW